MTSWAVCDSGIFLASVLIERYTPQAKILLATFYEKQITLAAPSLLQFEFVSVLRKNHARKLLTLEQAHTALDLLLSQPVQLITDMVLMRRALDIAVERELPVAYDAQYLALAERLQCEFWTLDERLYNAVSESLGWVKWIGNMPPMTTSQVSSE